MKTTLLLCSILLPVHAALAAPAPADVADAVKQTFARYRDALKKRDGKTAASLVSEDTLAEYARLGKLAVSADEATVLKEPLTSQLFILQLRHGMDLKGLKLMDGRAIFQHAVETGWLNADAFAQVEPGEVTVEGPIARLGYTRLGKSSPIHYEFRKDKTGKWRFDLGNVTKIADLGLQLAIEQSGVPSKVFLVMIVEQSTGRAVPDSIWTKPDVK